MTAHVRNASSEAPMSDRRLDLFAVRVAICAIGC